MLKDFRICTRSLAIFGEQKCGHQTTTNQTGKFPENKNLYGQVNFLKFAGNILDVSWKIPGFFSKVSGFLLYIYIHILIH